MTDRERIQRERAAIRARFGPLFDEVAALLFRADPVGVNFETNTDEYEPEVGTILPRLEGCTSSSDVVRVVHEEFVRWFGVDTAGPLSRYERLATDLWELWTASQLKRPPQAR